MPFELGLAVAWAILNPQQHLWVGCDAVPHRPLKSISDLNGTDFHIHEGKGQGYSMRFATPSSVGRSGPLCHACCGCTAYSAKVFPTCKGIWAQKVYLKPVYLTNW
jgi:hypothetical protein